MSVEECPNCGKSLKVEDIALDALFKAGYGTVKPTPLPTGGMQFVCFENVEQERAWGGNR